jgi:putative glutamine transport system permease protein
MYNLDFSILYNSLPDIINGLKITLIISVVSSFFAFVIGILLAFMRNTEIPVIRFFATTYVELLRNIPLLIILYLFYKGLSNIGFNLSSIMCGILALSLYTGAFISEVLRSGINSIAHEQYEAAFGLGLTRLQAFKMVIFPQAIRIILPPLGSQFINLIKNSSLVSFIAVTDLFYVVYKGAVDDFRIFEFFIIGAVIYMFLTGTVAILTNLIECYLKIPGRTAKI